MFGTSVTATVPSVPEGMDMGGAWSRPVRLSAGLLLVVAGVPALGTGTAGGQPAPRLQPYAGHEVSCNNATAAQLASCVTRLYTDDTGPYGQHAAGHVDLTPAAVPLVEGTTEQVGSWSVVADAQIGDVRLNAIHAILLPNGKVLMTAGSGNSSGGFAAGQFRTFVWDPAANLMQSVPTPSDVFCSGHSLLPDGRVLFWGGTRAYPVSGGHGYLGSARAFVFDWRTNGFQAVSSMHVGRWYPFGVTTANGDKVIGSGLDSVTGHLTSIVDRYRVAVNSWQVGPSRTLPLYATVLLARDGRLFYTGVEVFGRIGAGPGFWNSATNSYVSVPGFPAINCRDQGVAVLLYPAQAQEVMAVGGGCSTGVTRSTGLINLAAAGPRYVGGPSLPWSAMHLCGTDLADGTLFVSGGSDHNTNPRLDAAIYRFGAANWTLMAAPTVARMYHSSCLLLPDGRVLTMGSNVAPQFETRLEAFSPPYLYAGQRPTVNTALGALRRGGSYPISFTSQDGTLRGAILIRPAAVTHSSDPDQREIRIPIRVTAPGRVTLTIPTDGNIAPVGYYMLVVVDPQGRPSVARFVRLTP
jgi:hypothetical protein